MDELLPSLHYGATKATLPEQNQFALFKLARYPRFIRLANWFRGPHIVDAALTPLVAPLPDTVARRGSNAGCTRAPSFVAVDFLARE